MVDDDTIIEQVENTYDAAGNAILTKTRYRYHNAPANQTGPLQDPSTTPKARVTYVATYYDPFGRVIATADYGTNGGTTLTRPATVPARSDNRWYNYGGSADTDRIKYGYDRAGNRIWRQNTVATSLGKAFDEFYLNDGLHRLKGMQRGTLNAGKTVITAGTSTFAECWALDTTGNWSNYRQDDNGDGAWDLIQNRANNTVNEITNITEMAGPSWITPGYDAVGNMTTIPKPANPTVGYTGIYDAWNRLTAIKEGGDFIAEYSYDPAKRRTIQRSYSSGVLSETRHLYYTEPSKWQVIEERVGNSADAERQFVWGVRYIDDLVLRDRDTDGNGSLDERFYAMQDANWNVTAIANASGIVLERYAYSAYGVPNFLDAAFASRGSSSYQCEMLYAGYRYDVVITVYHIRNRVFDPSLGVWMQRDPQELTDLTSLYEYCESKPVDLTDPSGLQAGDDCLWSGLNPCPKGAEKCVLIDLFEAKTPTCPPKYQRTFLKDIKGKPVFKEPWCILCVDCWCPFFSFCFGKVWMDKDGGPFARCECARVA